MNPHKHVTVGGLTWAVVSANERATTHAGRHFFATRCRTSVPWVIRELDANIAETGSGKPLLVFRNNYETSDLSRAVREICGHRPAFHTCENCLLIYEGSHENCPACGTKYADPHPSLTHEEDWAAMQARRAALEVAA